MSSTTLRPTSTASNGTSSIGGGAGSRHAATSDDSDTTYVDVTGNFGAAMVLGFTDPSLDPEDIVTLGVVRVKGVGQGNYVSLGTILNIGSPVTSSVNLPTTTPITAAVLMGGGDLSELQVGFWRGGGGTAARLYEVFLDVYYITPPVVTITAPTGTLTESNRPTVTWTTAFDADSGGQSAYHVKVIVDDGSVDPDGDDAIAESILTPGTATSWVVDERLPNDDYVAAVRVANTVNGQTQWSEWDTQDFTVNVSPPDAPALTLTDQPSSLRVKIDVTPDNSPVGTDGVLVERSTDGTTWETVDTALGSSPVTLYDYLAPSGVSVSYRAFGWNDTASDRLYSTPDTESITPATPWRIVHPTDPTLSFAIDDRPNSYLRSNPTVTKAARQSISQPLGRSEAVATSDTRGPDSGSITFLCLFSKQDELEALLDSGASAFLLAGKASDSWRDRWVVFGEQEITRVVDQSWMDKFDVTLSWVEVAHEDG